MKRNIEWNFMKVVNYTPKLAKAGDAKSPLSAALKTIGEGEAFFVPIPEGGFPQWSVMRGATRQTNWAHYVRNLVGAHVRSLQLPYKFSSVRGDYEGMAGVIVKRRA